jgi:hypothetical protein
MHAFFCTLDASLGVTARDVARMIESVWDVTNVVDD